MDLIQALSILSFPRFKCLLIPVHLIIIHFSIFICSGELQISRRFVFLLCLHSRSFEDVTSFKPFNSTGAISFSSNHFNGVYFEWALTHMPFPRILPDSSNFSRSYPKFFSKFDVRMNYHQSNAFLQDRLNSFQRWLNLFHFYILECINNSRWCFSSSFLDFEDRRRVFLKNLNHSLRDAEF